MFCHPGNVDGPLRHALRHEVQTAYDSRMALSIARNFRPGVVFCALGLRVMDGYEVARQLPAFPETRDAVLVALTGYGQEEDTPASSSAIPPGPGCHQ
jgi:two-component system CheB/CheR fusion protein